jgi:hypothetical protein
MSTKLYDAIVSNIIGEGDYTLPSAAFAAGKKSIYIRNGTYVETANIVIPNGGSMIGESRNNVILNFTGTAYGVKVDSAPTTIQSVGLISLIEGSSLITGTSTSFTSLTAGNYISLGTLYAKIASITDDTHMNMTVALKGNSLNDIPYYALSMFSNIDIKNIAITGSTSTGLYIRGVRRFTLDSVSVLSCVPNIFIQYSGDSSTRQLISFNSTGIGMRISNCISISNYTTEVVNSSSHGLSMDEYTEGVLFTDLETSNNGGYGVSIVGASSSCNFDKCISKANADCGFYTGPNCYGVILDSLNSSWNKSYGAYLDGLGIVLSGSLIQSNGDHGIVIAGNECNVNTNVSRYNTEGIRITGSNNIVSNNVCRNSLTYACHITSTGVDNIVTYNNLTIAAYGNINDDGISSDITGNKS